MEPTLRQCPDVNHLIKPGSDAIMRNSDFKIRRLFGEILENKPPSRAYKNAAEASLIKNIEFLIIC